MITPQGGHGFAINLAIKFIVRNVVITPQGGHGFAMGGRDGKMCDVKSHVRSHMKSHIKCHAMKVNISGLYEGQYERES